MKTMRYFYGTQLVIIRNNDNIAKACECDDDELFLCNGDEQNCVKASFQLAAGLYIIEVLIFMNKFLQI